MIKQAAFFTDEIWSPVQIEGVKQGLYEVSNFGRVRNNRGDIIKPCIINTGYYVYRLFTGISGKYKQYQSRKPHNDKKALCILMQSLSSLRSNLI